MKAVPYASVVRSLMYAMLCTRPNICFAIDKISRYQSNLWQEHWKAVKHIIKYLKRTRDYMLVYQADSLVPFGYTNSDFHSDIQKVYLWLSVYLREWVHKLEEYQAILHC